MATCKICGKEFKKITPSHLKSHKITYDEYLKKYEQEKYFEKELIKFLNDFYITVRYRFLEYIENNTCTVTKDKRSWGLCDSDIKEHLQGNKTIGIYFPKDYTNLIAFDIDTNPDTEEYGGNIDKAILNSKDILNRLYDTLTNYGIGENNILISFSGKKGFHVDVFLEEPIDKCIVNKFYEVILNDLGVSKTEIELRGGGNQGYKLPLGYHNETNKYCYVCDEWGRKKDNFQDKINGMKKLNTSLIKEIVDMNYIESIDIDLITKYEGLDSSIKLLPIYQNTNDNRIKQVEKLIQEGLNEKGSRQRSIREVSSYCKDIKGYCLKETINFMNDWVNNKWSKRIIDDEVKRHIIDTPKSIYATGYRFNIQANKIKITLLDIKEIFSLKTNNKLQTEALRKLYYIMILHSKAYANTEGIFYITYDQLGEMGATKERKALSKQISKLAEMGKLYIIQRGSESGHAFKKTPNKYKLPVFITYEKEIKCFSVCNKGKLCENCLYKALCYLADDKERRKHIKGKAYKSIEECPYNK